MTTAPKRPTGLGPRGRKLWAQVTDAYDSTPAELELLAEACRVVDTIDALRTKLDTSSLVVKGSTGQDRVHPLQVSIERNQDLLRRLLNAIGLPPVEDEHQPVGKLAELRAFRHRNAG